MNTARTLKHDLFNTPIKKKGINSKAKGSANEREAARSLAVWVGAPFVRVPQSGALRWNDGEKVTGDVICDQPGFGFPLSVETKHLDKVEVQPELRTNSKVFKIMKQAYTDAIRVQKLPMVMLRTNGMRKFEYKGEKYQDYYIIFLNNPVGNFLRMYLKPVCVGENRNYKVTGFLLSQLIAIPYGTVKGAIRSRVDFKK